MISTRTRLTALPVIAAGAFAASLPLSMKALAQDSTPEGDASPMAEVVNPFADLGLPEIELEVTSDAVSGVPESIEAGRYLVIVHGAPSADDYAFGSMFLQLPEGMSLDDAMGQAQGAQDAPPDFYYDANIAGGPAILASSGANTAYGVIELTPGDWFVAGAQFGQPPVPMTVTGEMPSDLAEPETTATIELAEMSITVKEGSLAAGQNTVKVQNVGDQPHLIDISQLPDGTTEDQVAATLGVFMGTPAPDGMETLEELELESIAISSDQSSGTTQWVSWDLQPGTYVAMCWVTDRESGMPHAFMGMWMLFTIE